jgi:hypothetical protein
MLLISYISVIFHYWLSGAGRLSFIALALRHKRDSAGMDWSEDREIPASRCKTRFGYPHRGMAGIVPHFSFS